MFKEALMKAVERQGITLEEYYDKIYKPGTSSSKTHMYFKVESILRSNVMWRRVDFLYQDIISRAQLVLPLYYKSQNALEKQHIKILKIDNKLGLFYYLFNWLVRLHDEISQEGDN
jgi:hypothetical protein